MEPDSDTLPSGVNNGKRKQEMSTSRCKVAPESWGIGGSKMVSSRGLEGYEMFDPKDSRRGDGEEENA